VAARRFPAVPPCVYQALFRYVNFLGSSKDEGPLFREFFSVQRNPEFC
jgi:hypothetical protein